MIATMVDNERQMSFARPMVCLGFAVYVCSNQVFARLPGDGSAEFDRQGLGL